MAEQEQFQVHHIRFFEYQPQTINCIVHDETRQRVAISRSDASVEILSIKDNWSKEMFFPGDKDASVEALLWCNGRLFAGGISGNVVELDLTTQQVKNSISSNAGPIWCLAKNAEGDQIAAGTEDGCVALYDVSDELQFLRGFCKQEGRIISMAWYNRDGENLIITGGINNIRQWSNKSGQPISRMTLGCRNRKDTIVWCLKVTKDFTIISGDSRGVVTFWNGKESTQLKTFECHKADILSLCLSEDETRVYTGGVDAALYQFSLYTADPTSERKRWVHQLLHTRHTHDIRALAYVNGFLASGGVDTILYVAKLKGNRSVLEVSPDPLSGLIHIAKDKNLVQIQYQDYIEIWRLGAADAHFVEAKGMLPLTQKRIKLAKIKAREGQHILCSAMSHGGTIAFSDTKGVRVFNLNVENISTSQPLGSLEKIDANYAHPARLMTFSHDGKYLVAVLTTGTIQLMEVSTGRIKNTIKNISATQVHRIVTSPDNQHLAIATVDHGVHIYSLLTGVHICSCPIQVSQVSALAFSPHSPVLVIAYCNHSIYEFDVDKMEFTSWSRETSPQIPRNWLKPLKHIINICFCPDKPNKIIFHTSSTLCVLNKSKTLTTKEQDGKPNNMFRNMDSIVRSCYKYKYLLFVDITSNGMLIVVERPPADIEDNLPPSFKQTKFGTS
ncbi:unnamed protein product [Lymnaea stagnalis]|uniref:Cirhin n=1 Tax=Lymnaea stagnalis TaxID=6523 RepID=A0AAV2HHB3_LYMST